LSQSNNTSSTRLWRVFAAITFLNQLVRVPLLLSLATTVDSLLAYFIIAATSIPVQFIAQDILQYRSGSHRLSLFESLGMPIFACGSISYVTWHYGLELGALYLIFALALMFYGASVGRLRDVFPPERILASDAIYNTCTTLLAATAAVLLRSDDKLGHSVILAQAGTAAAVGLLNMVFTRRKNQLMPTGTGSWSPSSLTANTATPLMLAGIMVTTQLERLVIAASQPAILACIALAAGVTQAWRKIGMDDALVFERLRQRSDNGLLHAISAELKHARRVFYPPLLLCLGSYIFISDIAAWSLSHGIFPSLDRTGYVNTMAILCIYLAAMPPAIVMVNTLRLRIIPIRQLGWAAILTVTLLEIGVLVLPNLLGQFTNLALMLIALTASLYHMLFLSLIPVPLKESTRFLYVDVVVFFLILFAIIWIPVP
jgi:hypothetical protein